MWRITRKPFSLAETFYRDLQLLIIFYSDGRKNIDS